MLNLSTILKLRGDHSCTRARGLNSDLKTAAVMVKVRFDLDCLSPADFKVQLETKTVIRQSLFKDIHGKFWDL